MPCIALAERSTPPTRPTYSPHLAARRCILADGWHCLHPRFLQLPADKGPADLYAAVNIVRHPSMIRVEADEVTYPLHIIIR